MSDIKGYIVKNPINNRKDVKKFYSKNSFKVQRQRAITRLKKGFNVRDSTLKKYEIDRPPVMEEPDASEDSTAALSEAKGKYETDITLKQMQAVLNEMEGKTSSGVQKKNYSSKFKIFFIDANGCDPNKLNNCFDRDPQEMVDNLLEYGKKKKYKYALPGGKYNDYLTPIINILDRILYFKKKFPEHLKKYQAILHKNKDEHMDAAIDKAVVEPLKFSYEDWKMQANKMQAGSMKKSQDKALLLLYLEHTLRDDFGNLHLVKTIKDQPKDKNYFDTSTNTIYIYKPKKASSASLKSWGNILDRGFKIQNKDLIKLVKKLSKIKNRKLLFEYTTPNLAKPLKQIVKDLGLTDNFDMKSDFRRARITHEYDVNKLKNSEKKKLAHEMLHDQTVAEKLYYHPEQSK